MDPVYERLQELVPGIELGDRDIVWIQKVIDRIEELEDKLQGEENE